LEQCVLFTCDSDLGEHIFSSARTPPTVVEIQFISLNVTDVVPRLLAILDFDALRGHMRVIGEQRDRRTPFPARSDPHG
jgi:hypothetical protein